jgi:hypothetical protein
LGRGWYGDEDDFAVVDTVLDGVGESEALCGNVSVNEFFKLGLVDGDFSTLEALYFSLVIIDTNDGVANFCEAGS